MPPDVPVPATIATLPFSPLVALVDEPNMPSGGGATLRAILQASGLGDGDSVLEVGSNTGFSSIEMASWHRGPVTGIDINERSVAAAERKAARHGIGNVEFRVADGQRLPFIDDAFALVLASNVTSFMADREAAAAEYYRVLRPRGVLAVVPIHYHSEPPADLRREVERAIGASLPGVGRAYWERLFAHERAHLYYDATFEYEHRSDADIDAYVEFVMARPAAAAHPTAVRAALASRLRELYALFNENLQYAHYSILLYRLDHPNREPILHRSRPIRARSYA